MRFLAALFLLLPLCVRAAVPIDFAPFMTGNLITDWSTRVIANGGTIPSQSTIKCMENLRVTLIAQGITNKIYSLCVMVPDSVIAAATPLFIHKGYPMWTNNFVSGDLTVEGLKGDGTSKAMDTGVKGKTGEGSTALTGNSRGLSFLLTDSNGTN